MEDSEFARDLRVNQTEAEKKFWYHLRDRNFRGLKFRRQVKLGKYIVDFVCFDLKLIVEIDGGQHNGNKEDVLRDKYFNAQGYTVKRYWNNDVIKNIEGVLEDLDFSIPLTRLPCGSHPLPQGERDAQDKKLN